jgi:hypothetical protein
VRHAQWQVVSILRCLGAMTGLQEEAKSATSWGGQPQSELPVRPDSADPFDDVSLDDGRNYRAFVRSLMSRVHGKLTTKLDSDVQTEIAKTIQLLAHMRREIVLANRVYFELVFDILGAEQPNLLLATSIRREIGAINDRKSYGILRLVSYICGSTPLNAAVSSLISASALSFFTLFLMMGSARSIIRDMAGTSELFSLLDNHSVTLLVMTIHAAITGSIISVLARMQDFLTDPTQTPLFIYIAIIRKPFLAVAFAVLVFSILSSGLISLRSVDLAGAAGPYLAWVMGFLCGFSERFAQDFVISASGRFIGSSPPNDRPSQPSPNRS